MNYTPQMYTIMICQLQILISKTKKLRLVRMYQVTILPISVSFVNRS